jgi:hypothetical protein
MGKPQRFIGLSFLVTIPKKVNTPPIWGCLGRITGSAMGEGYTPSKNNARLNSRQMIKLGRFYLDRGVAY